MHPRPSDARPGTILIVVLIVIVALTGMVIVLCRAARVEAMASANHVAGVRAAAVERGAEQYAIALIAQQADAAMALDDTYFAAVPVGDAGYFWMLRPDFGDPELPLYGLVDEAGKLNLNSATSEMLQTLGMTPELADSIVDWRDGDTEVSGTSGAEEDHYLSLGNPYRCKNAPFETVEELLLVKGASQELLYGTGYGGGSTSIGDAVAAQGFMDYLTVYSYGTRAAGGGGGGGDGGGGDGGGGGGQTQRLVGPINVNTAVREVLLCLPGLDEGDVTALTQGRTLGETSIDWVVGALGQKATAVAPLITGTTTHYSADVLAASADGRAFRRVRVVIDATDTTYGPRIIYRRDLTARGWPLDPAILQSLRQGNGPGAAGSTGGAGTVGSGPASR